MPDSPAGVYTLPPSYKVNNGDTSDASQHNPPFEDIAAALTERLCRDGRTSWTGNQNANGHKLTNLAPGTNPGDALTVDGIGTAIASAPKKSAIVNTDRIALSDSEDSQKLKYVTVETISDLVKNDLGNAATRDVGTTSGTVAAGDDSRITGALQRSGGTMTGALTLSGNPTSNLHAATKQYVDNAVASVPTSPVGLYTGSSAGATNLPVGHHVIVNTGGAVDRNATDTVRLDAGASSSYTSSGSGSQLSGTWRARGLARAPSTAGSGINYYTLMQRTA